ncbi:MAG TPA: tetratricopeptide repeat protein [Polyangia bacterium]|nr:tetratricopeptide repeat protein [Polyangia bacterium]
MVAHRRPDRLARAIQRHQQAIAARTDGRFGEAARAARAASALYAAAEGPRHPDVAHVLVELGQIEEARDRLPGARRCYQRALALLGASGRARSLDPDVGRLRVQAGILFAGAERGLGRFAAADRAYQRTFVDARRWLDGRDPDRGGLLNNWGMLRKYQGRFPEAIRFYRRALRIARANRDREALANLYHNLGGVEHARGRFAAGVPHARRSVALREAIHGRDAVAVAADLAALAALVDGTGRLAEAAVLYGRALAVFRKRLGPRSSEVGLTLAGLADVRQKQGRAATAERIYRQSLSILERILGRDHPDVALTVHNLAHARRAAGDLRAAEPLYARALRAFQRALGPRHPHTRACRAAHEEVRRAPPRAQARPASPRRRGRGGIS